MLVTRSERIVKIIIITIESQNMVQKLLAEKQS